MSKNQVMEKVLAIHDLLISHGSRRGRSPDIDRLNQLMSEIKSVGCIEKMTIDGGQGTYLVMDGQSWQDACRDLGVSTAPSFVMWEETAFFSFIQSELMSRVERPSSDSGRGGHRAASQSTAKGND